MAFRPPDPRTPPTRLPPAPPPLPSTHAQGLIIVTVTFVRDPLLRIYCTMWVLLLCLALQWGCRPFEAPLANALETASLAILAATLNMALLWSYPPFRAGSAAYVRGLEVAAVAAGLALHAGLLVGLGLAAVRDVRAVVRAKRAEVVRRKSRRPAVVYLSMWGGAGPGGVDGMLCVWRGEGGGGGQWGRLWKACGQRCVDSKNSQTTPATTSTSSIRQLLGAADTQTAHHATFSTVPTRQPLGSANAKATPARAPAAAADRKQRPDATCEGTNG